MVEQFVRNIALTIFRLAVCLPSDLLSLTRWPWMSILMRKNEIFSSPLLKRSLSEAWRSTLSPDAYISFGTFAPPSRLWGKQCDAMRPECAIALLPISCLHEWYHVSFSVQFLENAPRGSTKTLVLRVLKEETPRRQLHFRTTTGRDPYGLRLPYFIYLRSVCVQEEPVGNNSMVSPIFYVSLHMTVIIPYKARPKYVVTYPWAVPLFYRLHVLACSA